MRIDDRVYIVTGAGSGIGRQISVRFAMDLKPMVGATPQRRMGTPEDIAATALFLTSDESSFITGQWISPNAGLVMC